MREFRYGFKRLLLQMTHFHLRSLMKILMMTQSHLPLVFAWSKLIRRGQCCMLILNGFRKKILVGILRVQTMEIVVQKAKLHQQMPSFLRV